MNEKQEVRPRTFGLSLLIVTFLVLCLMTFAAISITEARHDLTGSEKKYAKVVTYNEACNTAELMIEEYTRKALLAPAEAEQKIEFSVPVDEADDLHVSAELERNEASAQLRYRITRWQVTSRQEWVLDDRIEVLPDGELGW